MHLRFELIRAMECALCRSIICTPYIRPKIIAARNLSFLDSRSFYHVFIQIINVGKHMYLEKLIK
jgi:hypothetical protein